MKKIILGFGALGAIAIPVATVISCGTDTAKTVEDKQLKAFNAVIGKYGFKLDKESYAKFSVAQKALFEDNTEIVTLKGQESDGATGHGSDSLIIVVKKGKQLSKTPITLETIPNTSKTGVWNILDSSGKVNASMSARWGLTEAHLKDATGFITIQKYDTGNSSIGFNTIYKSGAELVVLPASYLSGKDNYQEHVRYLFAKDYSFVMKDSGLTFIKPTTA